ncbi:uncharacterized protein FOMMEDRAFT_105292 [Fomitiporia mediterranea MF3/22]|uniref:uncharacterized protein n=1 Tax=Fomitiporia mediterranea (strain MF3/22) TaxID=694068 RepID=UPI0004408662|nr:uncharacterized protein FOMMEDRAFT_105292 [Fomitiporia mediterranea MF3/22]EJD05052.1 hypothetical protein FOMMEDRAFT_105292 [Fomitiporia mediterranea MF3/22]
MPTALASQLAKGVSLNAPLLSETARKKHFASSSYLFSASTKGQIDDLDSIHALVLNALAQLRHIYPSVAAFDEQSQEYRLLFSQRARETDRTLLAKDDLAELNAALKSCLSALGTCLMENTAGRIIEWLVRRFRVNEFNVPDVLALFLPYHESPHFAKMVFISTVDDSTPWRFLSAYKASGKPVHRNELVTEMLRDRELTRFVVSLLPETLSTASGRNVHRTLICFNTSVVLEYVTRAEKRDLDAPILAFLLPALTEPLKDTHASVSQQLRKDAILGSFVLLAALSQKCTFTVPAVKTVMSGMVHCAAASSSIGAYQLLTATISFLGPQAPLDTVSPRVVDEMIALPDFTDALKASLGWSGVEKLILPLLGRLVENVKDETNTAVLQLLLISKRTPKDVLLHLSKRLLLSSESSEILSGLYQRYPDLLRSAAEGLTEEDERRKSELDRTLMTLAMPDGTSKAPQDVVLAASNADPTVRANAVRRIVELLADNSEELNADERSTLQEALMGRMYDTSTVVLDALYADSKVFLPLLANSADVLSKLATFLTEQNVSRAVLRSHLTFFCNAFVATHPEHTVQVALTLVFPNALFSKPRGKTAAAVWEVVVASRLGENKLFIGTRDIIEKCGDDVAETNNALTKKLAENIKTSNDYSILLTWLLKNISEGTDAHTRLFSLLISRALLTNLSGENHIDAALDVLQTMNPSSLDGSDKIGDDENALDEETALKHVVLKPSSRATARRLQLMILCSLAATPIPQNRSLDWFSSSKNTGDEEISARYLRLMRVVYTTINAISSNLNFVSRSNHALFETFGSESLLFLASVWVSPEMIEGADPNTISYVALRHASAFLRAQSTDKPIDFQLVLPALLAALQASDRRVRAAAMECVASMAGLSVASKPGSVYAYDRVYGAASARLQYLDWADESNYLNLLVQYRDHLVNDSQHLELLHYEQLSRSKAENKKDAKQRHRILCYMLSHAVCCPSPTIRLAILKSLRRVSDTVKLQMLLPIIEEALESPISTGDEKELQVYALEAFDSSSAKEVNPEDSSAWFVFKRAVKHYFSNGAVMDQWTCLCKTLKDSLFSALSVKRQHEISLLLIELGSGSGNEDGIKHLLTQCVKKPNLMISLLQSLQPDVKDTSDRVRKRAKTDEPSSDSESTSLSRLAFLAEILSSQKLPGSLDLVSALLDALSRVASSTAARADIIYAQQLLMTCLESAVSHIQELPTLSPNAVRVDVLVELMRTSENPQTFNQALLLMASLARLSPASVLHNVMPIFTFMGSNVFHRDDSYSFKVIQKTIESIVPVAIASLKEKYDSALDLYVGSRDLLRTFTDASTHVPRHRRTSFFTHLIDVLNPTDYLAPILMLLADKSANRVSRQEKQEAQTTLTLPLGVMQHYAPNLALSACKEIINEVRRLVKVIEQPASDTTVFLEANAPEEQVVSPSTLRKRQCQTLLILVGFGIKQIPAARLAKAPSDDLQTIVTSLMELSTLDQSEKSGTELQEIGNSAQWALFQSMSVISASFFSSTILSMLSSDNKQIYQAAFSLLASRVPDIKTEAREEISSTMAQIVTRMKDLVPSFQDTTTIAEAMKALLSIGSTSCAKEESALTNMIPVITDIVRKYPGICEAVAVLPVLSTRLGPRVIPYLRSLVDTCVTLVKSYDKALSYESLVQGLYALNSLLRTIPSFWGVQEIKLVIDLYLDEELAVSKNLSSNTEKLVKLLAKQLPSKILLSSLLQCWPSIEELRRHNGTSRYGRFFELLKRCLHFASRSDMLENLRDLFNHFLQAFDVRSLLTADEALSVEDKIIAAYVELVVKLNETAFQPLFRRSCDWAFGESSSPEKQIAFCRQYTALLDLFKELMTPYTSFVLTHIIELLKSFSSAENTNKALWLSSIEMLSKSFVVDDGAYWLDSKLALVTPSLASQVPICINMKLASGSGKEVLITCLTTLLDCLDDDSTLKTLNTGVLSHTRSEDTRVRIFALQCAVALWEAHGSKLRGLGNETATYIIECAEDVNDDVVRACRQLKDVVQASVGKIEGL